MLTSGWRVPWFSRRTVRHIAAVTAAVAILIFCARLVGSGRLSYTALAFAIALTPVLLYAALVRPFAFPFALWAALVPFDNLLSVSRGTTATRLLAIACGAILLFWVLRHKKLAPPPLVIFAWLIYAGWATASIAWSSDPNTSIVEAERIAQLVLLFVVVSIVPATAADVKVVLGGAVLGGIASAAYGSWLFHHQDPAIAAAQEQFSRLQIDVSQGSIDVNQFADALLFPSIALIVGMLGAKRFSVRIGCGLGLAICLIALNYSGSRESFVALAAGLLYLFLTSPRYRRGLFATGAIALGASLLNAHLWLRFAQSFATGGSGRSSIWKTAVAAVREHPIIGVGAGNFASGYNSVYLTVFQKYSAGWSRASHNIFLHALVELGSVGFLTLIVALIAQYRTTDAIANDGQWAQEKAIVRASMVALIVAAFFIDMMGYKYLWLLFCFMAILRNAPQYAPGTNGRDRPWIRAVTTPMERLAGNPTRRPQASAPKGATLS